MTDKQGRKNTLLYTVYNNGKQRSLALMEYSALFSLLATPRMGHNIGGGC